ncbi:MAG: hypothetical protein GX601_08555 [Anaerolineales bacterium]|nr:hypothetical protein [Anaerolineales bacterium]
MTQMAPITSTPIMSSGERVRHPVSCLPEVATLRGMPPRLLPPVTGGGVEDPADDDGCGLSRRRGASALWRPPAGVSLRLRLPARTVRFPPLPPGVDDERTTYWSI